MSSSSASAPATAGHRSRKARSAASSRASWAGACVVTAMSYAVCLGSGASARSAAGRDGDVGERVGDDLDQDLLAACIDANLDGSTRTTGAESTFGKDFFIRKAIGWALRDHFRTDPGWVVDFVDGRGTRLSGLSRREALKHAIGTR